MQNSKIELINNTNLYSDSAKENIAKLLENEYANFKGKIIVLDDDPTGSQCVHDINVYTDYSYQCLLDGFKDDNKMFFILTNSRSFSKEKTSEVHKQIAKDIAKISKDLNIPFILISRGDSTLRGHYPLEMDVLKKTLEENLDIKYDGEILCPFFDDGNRYTIDDIHYIYANSKLIPCGESEFAKDETFGYKASNLKEYIEEKSNGLNKKEGVLSIDLDLLLKQDYDAILEILLKANNNTKIIVNAVCKENIKVFAICLYRAFKTKKYLIRSAAALVKEMGNVSSLPLLSSKDFKHPSKNGGLIIVGSHTAKTTKQLEMLKNIPPIVFKEYNSDLVLESNEALDKHSKELAKEASELISEGKSVCIFTNRKLLTLKNDSKEEALKRSVDISKGLVKCVSYLEATPAYVLAKGGITSSDVATKGLKISKAKVLGQIEKGVPVWQSDKNSLFADIPYIVFPGNVGQDDTLLNAIKKLEEK